MDVVILKNKLTKFFKAQSALTAPASIDSTVDSWAAIIQYATTLSKVLQNISKTASSAGFLYNDGRGNFDYKLVSTDGGSNTGVIIYLTLPRAWRTRSQASAQDQIIHSIRPQRPSKLFFNL